MSATLRSSVGRAFRRTALPLGWYYAVTLALPLANGAGHAGSTFVGHALVVLVLPPVLIGLLVCTIHVVGRTLLGRARYHLKAAQRWARDVRSWCHDGESDDPMDGMSHAGRLSKSILSGGRRDCRSSQSCTSSGRWISAHGSTRAVARPAATRQGGRGHRPRTRRPALGSRRGRCARWSCPPASTNIRMMMPTNRDSSRIVASGMNASRLAVALQPRRPIIAPAAVGRKRLLAGEPRRRIESRSSTSSNPHPEIGSPHRSRPAVRQLVVRGFP
jgi:hypothetical protein